MPYSWQLFKPSNHNRRGRQATRMATSPLLVRQLEPTAPSSLLRVGDFIIINLGSIVTRRLCLYLVSNAPISVVSVPSIGDLRLGDRVIVTSSQGSKAGVLRYLGTAEFAVGQWAGVELDDPLGKNDGSVAGTRYFECQPHYGLFAPIHKVSRSPANQMRRTSGALNSSMSSSASHRAGLMSRQSTRDSIGGSSAASVTSVATSRASTAISRVRSTINNPRLGVNSLTTNSPTHQSVRQVFS